MLISSAVERVYLAGESTDLRKSIDGLAALVSEGFHLDLVAAQPYVIQINEMLDFNGDGGLSIDDEIVA